MKKYFYFGIIGLILFEIANVYFIMPMPGSQEMNSIDLAYFLYTWRWLIRGVFGLMILLGLIPAFKSSKIISVVLLLAAISVIYATNFQMAADAMFLQTKNLQLKPASENKVKEDRIIIGVEHNGEAQAYPIQYLGYHHQVTDSIAGKPIIVTYCTVCRTGRVYEPIVNGKPETFRLVGMDHFNAMFEDKTTRSWWRQATGEAIAGALKGKTLPEMKSVQMSLKSWLELYPNTRIMQPDIIFQSKYDSMSNYETGRRDGKLTRRVSLSWQNKSWVVGVALGNNTKAYDWNVLEKDHIIYDMIADKPIAVVLANDNKSFSVLQRINTNQKFTLSGDTLVDGLNHYNLLGTSFNASVANLEKVNAYQEYWHSWRTFHPMTEH